MYIGTFAKITGTTPKTIRHYEALGLLPAAPRRGKYRVYNQSYTDTVLQIKRAQKLGFTLAEISKMAGASNATREFPVAAILQAITTKREQLQQQIDRLRLQQQQLDELSQQVMASPCRC